MLEKLSKKDQEFVKEIVLTGNGTEAVKKVYGAKNDNAAAANASKKLTKPKFAEAVAELRLSLAQRLPDDILEENHKALFKQKRVDYFVFPKTMEDEEIKQHVLANGLEVITVRTSDKGKMAFYSIPDAMAISKGLDMGYKLKGAYAPDKSINLNLNGDIVATEELEALADQLNELARNKEIHS